MICHFGAFGIHQLCQRTRSRPTPSNNTCLCATMTTPLTKSQILRERGNSKKVFSRCWMEIGYKILVEMYISVQNLSSKYGHRVAPLLLKVDSQGTFKRGLRKSVTSRNR